MAKKSKQELLEDETSFSESIESELSKEQPEPEEEVSEPGEETEEEKGEVPDLEQPESTEEEPAPSTKIKIGDVEYDPDELNALLEKGKFAKKVEEEQKIDISQLYPEFTKRSQVIKNPEALKRFAKETYGFDVEEKPLSDDDKALQAQIEAARNLGFLTKEDKEALIGDVIRAIEVREVGKAVDSAVSEYKVDRSQLIDFMSYLNTRDAKAAAEKLALYQKISSVKPTTPTPVMPKKPEVLKTETKGTGIRVLPKEKPVPHPDRDPEGFARVIESFLEQKSPEEI